MDHENLKNLHEIGRGGHEELLGTNDVKIRQTKLPEFTIEVLSSNG